MKRVVITLIAIIGIVIVAVIGVFVLFKTGIINFKSLDSVYVYTHETEDGKLYTEREWVWTPIESDEQMKFIDTSKFDKQTITVSLSSDSFYNITVPNKNYIYDFGKTIWAEDGSYTIRVIADCDIDNLAKLAGIDNPKTINQLTLCSQDEVKGMKVVATLVDDYAIVANIYSGNDNYSIIRESLASGATSYKYDEIQYMDNYVKLREISYNGKYVPQVEFQEVDLSWNRYLFAEGELYVQSVYVNKYEAEEEYLRKLMAMSGMHISTIYRDNAYTYASSGDCYVGLVSYNANTTIALIGRGEEAKCNIVSIMNYLK